MIYPSQAGRMRDRSMGGIVMAGIRLYSGESLIGQGLVSYRDLEKHTYQCWHATIYVTSQRVFLSTYTDIELKLSNIRGFTFGRILLFSRL